MKSTLRYFCFYIVFKIVIRRILSTDFVCLGSMCWVFLALGLEWSKVVHVIDILQVFRLAAFRDASDTLICFYVLNDKSSFWSSDLYKACHMRVSRILLVTYAFQSNTLHIICVSVEFPSVCVTLIIVPSYYYSIGIFMLTKFPVKVVENLTRVFVTVPYEN